MLKTPACPSCSHNFAAKDGPRASGRWVPLLLQCGHTYCEACLSKISRQLKTHITCPTCQGSTPLPGGDGSVASLQPDIYTLGLTALNKKHLVDIDNIKLVPPVTPTIPHNHDKDDPGKLEKESCSECPRAATCWCTKCEVNMCSLCFDKVHRRVNALKNHQSLPLADNNTHVPTTCSLHDNRLIEYFCDDDEEFICSHCVIVGKHHQHAITALEEKNKSILQDLDPALQEASKVLHHLRRSDKIVRHLQPELKAALGVTVQLLHTHFLALHSSLQTREMALVQDIIKAFQNEALPLEEQRVTLLEEIRKLDIVIKEAQKIVNNQNLVVGNAQHVLDQLQQAKQTPCFLHKDNTQAFPLKCQFDDEETLKKVILDYGKVEGGKHFTVAVLPLADVAEDLLDADDDDSVTTATSSAACNSREPSVAGDTPCSSELDSISIASDVSCSSASTLRTLKKTKVNYVKSEIVYVTHIKHPCHFMVQKRTDADRQKQLSRQINKYANGAEAKKRRPSSLVPDDLVLARYSLDQNWYRGRVKQVFYEDNPNVQIPSVVQAEIYYLDYGNSEVVPLERLTSMQKRFTNLPAMALQCSLVDIVPATETGLWSKEAVEAFARMSGDKPMVLNVLRNDGNLHGVDLSKPPNDDIPDDRPLSLRDALVFMELACFVSPASVPAVPGGPILYPLRKFLKPDVVAPGNYMEVMVSHINSPDSFYVQMLGDEAVYLTSMMVDLQKAYSADTHDLYTIFCPQKNMVCASQFSQDKSWYRAQVVEVPGRGNAVVQYVDYGNTEVVPFWRLKKLHDNFMVLPAQGIHCQLADVKPMQKDNKWTQEAISFISLFNGRQLVINIEAVEYEGFVRRFKQGVEDAAVRVIMHDTSTNQDVCLNSLLVQQGFAASTGPSSALPAIQPVSVPAGGATITNGPVDVHNVTHPPHSQTRSGSASPALKSKSPTPETQPVGKGASTETQKDVNQPQPSHIQVLVSHVVDPSDFYVQIASAISCPEGLNSLMASLQKHYSNHDTKFDDSHDAAKNNIRNAGTDNKHDGDGGSFQAGDYCVAQFTRDNLWYRARVVRTTDEHKAEVLLVDYGYSDSLPPSRLRPIAKPFINRSALSLRCQLTDVQPAGGVKWTKTACEFLKEKLEKKTCFLVEQGEAQEGVAAPIDLLLETFIPGDALNPNTVEMRSMRNMMVDQGLALPKRRTRLPETGNKSLAIPPKPADPGRPSIPSCSSVFDLERSLSTEARDNVITTSAKNGNVESSSSSDEFEKLPSMTGGVAWADLVQAEESTEQVLPTAGKRVNNSSASTADVIPTDSISSTDLAATDSTHAGNPVPTATRSQVAAPELSDCTDNATLIAESSPVSPETKETTLDGVTQSTPGHSSPTTETVTGATSSCPVIASCDVAPTFLKHMDAMQEADKPACAAEGLDLGSRGDEATSPQLDGLADSPALQPDGAGDTLDGDSLSQFNPVFPPPDLPEKDVFKVIPTYVAYSGHVYVQEVKDDESAEGRFGFLLKERTLETIIQDHDLQWRRRHRAHIPRDGNCLFRCFAQGIFQDQSQQEVIRKTVVQTLRERWDEYRNTIEADRDTYLQEMSKSGTYGGEPEITAACTAYEVQACVNMGGLDYPVQRRTYCDQFKSSIELIYISDGHHDGGHYDLVVSNLAEVDNAEAIYQGWRWHYISEMRSVTESADYTTYDDSLLGQLMEKLVQHYMHSAPQLDTEWQVGQCVIAYYSSDGQYYRSRIEEIAPRGIKVHHIDFGDSEWVSPDKLRCNVILGEIPQQCQECSLVGIMPATPDGEWPTKVLEYMHNLVVGKEVVVNVQETPVHGRPLKVTITMEDGRDLGDVLCEQQRARRVYADGSDMSLELVYERNPGSSTPPPTILTFPERKVPSPYLQVSVPPPGGCMYVIATHLNSPSQMFVQNIRVEQTDDPWCLANNEQLDSLTLLIQEMGHDAEQYPHMARHKPGLPCAAKYTVDDCWYRAEIIDVVLDPPNTFLAVLFVDYGTQEFLTPARVRAIPEDLLSLPAQALRVQVAGLLPPDGGDTWMPDTKDIATQVVGEKQLLIQVKSLEPEILVDVYDLQDMQELGVEGEERASVFQVLVDSGLAQLLPVMDGGTIVEDMDSDSQEKTNDADSHLDDSTPV